MLTFKQTCVYLGISASTLYRLMNRGDVIGYKVAASRWRYRKAELDVYLASVASVAPLQEESRPYCNTS